ncbi:MAG: hypothetical protein KIS68_07850 [Bauldia sp.]|nr:hypothetical protein [Bauldia sp.]
MTSFAIPAGRHAHQGLLWTIRFCVLAISVIAATNAAEAQGPPVPSIVAGPPPSNYVEWRDGTSTREGIAAWDHEPANRHAWREQVEGFWALFDGVVPDRATIWLFLVLGDDDIDRYDIYEAQWIAECLANGDIVIPYAARRHPYALSAQYGGTMLLAFAVFAAGAPAEGVERVLRYRLERQALTPEEIETVVETYRAMYGPH